MWREWWRWWRVFFLETPVLWPVFFLIVAIAFALGIMFGLIPGSRYGLRAQPPAPVVPVIVHKVHPVRIDTIPGQQPVDWATLERAGELAHAMSTLSVCDLSPLACLQRPSPPEVVPDPPRPATIEANHKPRRITHEPKRSGGDRRTVAVRTHPYKFSDGGPS